MTLAFVAELTFPKADRSVTSAPEKTSRHKSRKTKKDEELWLSKASEKEISREMRKVEKSLFGRVLA